VGDAKLTFWQQTMFFEKTTEFKKRKKGTFFKTYGSSDLAKRGVSSPEGLGFDIFYKVITYL
jgi:hypothetical protein